MEAIMGSYVSFLSGHHVLYVMEQSVTSCHHICRWLISPRHKMSNHFTTRRFKQCIYQSHMRKTAFRARNL